MSEQDPDVIKSLQDVIAAIGEELDQSRSIFEALPGGLVRTSRSGHILFATERIHEVVGYWPRELIGQHALQYIASEEHARLREHLLTVKRLGRSPEPVVLMVMHANGTRVRVQASYVSELDAQQELQGFVASYRVAQRGVVVGDWLDLAREMSDTEYVLWEPDGAFSTWSPGALTLLGFDDESPALGATDWMQHVIAADQETLKRRITMLAQGLSVPLVIVRVRRGDEALRWIQIDTRLSVGANGKVERGISLLKDVSEAMRSERSQKRQALMLKVLIDGIPDAVLQVNSDLGVRFASEALHHVLGVDPARVIGKRMSEVWGELACAKLLEDAFVQSFDRQTRITRAFDFPTPNGRRFVEAIISADNLLDEESDDDVSGLIVLLRDITATKLAELQARESSARLERLLNASDYGVCSLDSRGAVTFVNRKLDRLLRLPPTGMLGRSVLDLVSGNSRERLRTELSRCERGESVVFVHEFECLNGDRLLCRVQLQPLLRADHRREGYISYWFDQSDLQRAERRAASLNDRLSQVLESVSEGIAFFDPTGNLLFVNRRLTHLLGHQDLSVPTVASLFGPRHQAVWKQLLEAQGSQQIDLPRATGGTISCYCHLVMAAQPDGTPEGYLLTVEDATQGLRGRMAVDRLSKLLNTAGEGIVFTNERNQIEYANQKFAQLLGYDPGELHGLTDDDLLIDVPEAVKHERFEERRMGIGEKYDARMRMKNGGVRPVGINVTPLFDERGAFEGNLVTISDMSQRQELEHAVRSTAEWLEAALGNAGIGSFDVDLTTGVVRTAGLIRELYPQPFNFDTWIEHVHPDSQARVNEALAKVVAEGRATFELRNIEQPERWFYGVLGHAPGAGPVPRVIGTLIDISILKRLEGERSALQSQIAQTQRQESMGLLAGGIAHDFNNLLTSAVGHLELAKLQVSDPKEVGESLSMIDQALVQMTGLARQLQTYSGRARTNLKPVDLNQAIASVTAILRVSAGKHCTFELDLAPHPMVVLGEVTQLQQIVMNLVINAAEAMGERGGTIKVTTRASHVGEVPAALRGNLADGPLAQLQVTDTGPGMPEHVRARVFEPFFSSKANGRGLGLAVVTGAVKSHGGVIDLESELGKGASFRMWLPLRPELKVEEERPTHALPKQAIKGKVLLVDDEDSVRKMVARAVSMRGATVIEAENGQIAVDKLKSEGDIALIIMDIVMPVLGGVDAFLKMRELGFQTPVILMSGFAERQVLDRLGDDRPIAMLRKPFRPAELLKHVEDVLK